jgi:Rho GDP-dissociation inhibitor
VHGPSDAPDANDDSLQRYKASLGLLPGAASKSASSAILTFLSLSLESPGREPISFDVSEGSQQLENAHFRIQQGAHYAMVVRIRVNNDMVSGLKYVHAVKRKGVTLEKREEMLVCRSVRSCRSG